ILIGVGEDTGLSKVMNVLKGNFSRDANRMMNHIEGELHIEGDPPEGRLQTMGRIQRDKIHDQFHIRIRDEINTFIFKCDHESFANIPKFQWHKSFHDHYIRDERDFYHHIQYIQNQWIKHSLKENKYCYIMEDIL
ncbi:MAG: hypothetical protein KDK45_26160, partial [Leptospiraceae bacterium]|nr:hypothetical protein [Leptospiraceae bacterium]